VINTIYISPNFITQRRIEPSVRGAEKERIFPSSFASPRLSPLRLLKQVCFPRDSSLSWGSCRDAFLKETQLDAVQSLGHVRFFKNKYTHNVRGEK
jgi:hypothetical protein